MNKRYKLLFDLVWQEVSASGGDGDGIVVFGSPFKPKVDLNAIANQFEEWMKENNFQDHFKRENISDTSILFTDGSDENIIFYAKSGAPDPTKFSWSPEIYLEVWDWN